MKHDLDQVLFLNCDIRYLLSGLRVHLIDVLHKLHGTKNILQIKCSREGGEVVVGLPPLRLVLQIFILIKELFYFLLRQRLAILLVRAALLAVDSADVIAEERSHLHSLKGCQGLLCEHGSE